MVIFMKKLRLASFLLLATMATVHADKPLQIGITQLTYPFVIQGENQLYGFDIAMMTYVCTTIQRECQYKIMPFNQLLPAVASKQVDVAVSAITITEARSEIVNFSIPYFISETRFIAQEKMGQHQITVELLSNSKIGGLKGTIVDAEISSLGVTKPDITHFDSETAMIEALNEGSIDLALLDEPTAIYWQVHSAGKFITIGKPITYGFGLGIAINKEEIALLKEINAALLEYQNSKNFKIDYAMYLEY